jgi:hypothetical protein
MYAYSKADIQRRASNLVEALDMRIHTEKQAHGFGPDLRLEFEREVYRQLQQAASLRLSQIG